ncbi:MAG: hypothetical protein SCARUB_02784 [Candidatus Scalindua rubra]|uniref:Clp ATPase C-terminal domain-containing protein n=1 Tax=Candidatus Scalindua rubra TaxID=1872076 RepID=A0A1E3X8W0_9BACT|nr:MAG: hypothetical protein SCARUB_02784 [Candidatus Scalindua rubra]
MGLVGVTYPLLVELSPDDLIEGYKMGAEEWTSQYPKGNYELLIATLKSMCKKEVVVTREGNNFIYFNINNIPYQPEYGARPINRLIRRDILSEVSKYLLENPNVESINIKYDNGVIVSG